MGETVFDLLDGHRHIIPARLLARIESAHARELQSEKARADAAEAALREERERLDYIERTFSGMTNRERYLPVQMVWGKGAMGRTLREACDKYMKRDARLLPGSGEVQPPHDDGGE